MVKRRKVNDTRGEWPLHKKSYPCPAKLPFGNNGEFIAWAQAWKGHDAKKFMTRVLGNSLNPETIKLASLHFCCNQSILDALKMLHHPVPSRTAPNACWVWSGYVTQASATSIPIPTFMPMKLVCSDPNVKRYYYECTWGALPPRCRLAACQVHELCVNPTHIYPQSLFQRDTGRTRSWWWEMTPLMRKNFEIRGPLSIGVWPDDFDEETLWVP